MLKTSEMREDLSHFPLKEVTTFQQLRVFAAAARSLSFTRAAQELHLSQPAVSLHIRQLEKGCGIPLFDRRGKKLLLTEAGKLLYSYSSRILGLLDELDEELKAYRGSQKGTLSLVADTTAGVYVVPAFLRLFRETHPGVKICLEVKNRTLATSMILENTVELAIIGQIPEEEEITAIPFMVNELVVIASPRHPLVGKRLNIKDLEGENWIFREEGSGTRATSELFFRRSGANIRPTMELGSNSAVKQAVANDLGIAVISRQAIALELSSGLLAVLDIDGFPLLRHWHLAHRRGKKLSPPALSFKKLLLSLSPMAEKHPRE